MVENFFRSLKLFTVAFVHLLGLFQWKNHEQSLRLEENLMNQIHDRVQKKVQNREGSLIDWQYLMDAGKLLLKVLCQLQYYRLRKRVNAAGKAGNGTVRQRMATLTFKV